MPVRPFESTCWTMIRGAAAGDSALRQVFARRYGPVIRAYLAARWRTSPHRGDVDDAVQDVFVECYRPDGALVRIDGSRPGGFRSFLFGVVRNVARRIETTRTRSREHPADLDRVPDDDPGPVAAFDRAWAKAIVRQAAERQEAVARTAGADALRRVALLRLRFHDGRPIREIAGLWGDDPARVHREYAKARDEFRAALTEVVAFHHPGSPDEVERECTELIARLGS